MEVCVGWLHRLILRPKRIEKDHKRSLPGWILSANWVPLSAVDIPRCAARYDIQTNKNALFPLK